MWEASKRRDTMAIRRKRKLHPRKVKRGELTHVVNQALRQTLACLTAVGKHLDATRRVYNACLGELLARCKRLRADRACDAAKVLFNWPHKSKELTRLSRAPAHCVVV